MDESSQTSLLKKSVFISAGEQSGEMHGAELIRELRAQSQGTDLSITALGGGMMKSRGGELLYHVNSLAAVGLLDVAKKYSFFKKVLRDCLNFVKKNPPEAVILIDYPGFNLKFAEELRKFYTGKIIYYISPQLWAWHEKRVYKIKKNVDKMLVVFPFEVEFYRRFDVDAEYVGHPLVKRIKEYLASHTINRSISSDTKRITLLPGSRNNEIKNHLPVLLETAKELGREFKLSVKISKAVSVNEKAFAPYKDDLKDFVLTDKSVYDLVLDSDLALVKSGTSTLECALIGTPHLIFLRTARINYMLLRPIVKINNIGIVNIIAGENIVKEFIQKDFTPANLVMESRKILTDQNYSKELTDKLKIVWEILGDKDASYNAAKSIKQIAMI